MMNMANKMGSNINKYKFTVIVPIYKVEEYLEDTILSVINQTIGFKENIQLILVNDGSPDNSDKICKKYLDKYPKNIVYIEQENSGVSVARNNGMNYIEGKYVNFLDSDDKWDIDTFDKVWNFFEKYEKKIDVVACPLCYFEAAEGYGHPLNFKFDEDRIIHTEYDYSCIQMHMASCFIKRSSIDFKFNEKLKYGEDSLFINQIILKKQRFGVMQSVNYFYRKRHNETSAIDICQKKKCFYNDTLENFHDNIIAFARERFEKIPYYVQYLIMYDLQWRVKRPIPNSILNDNEAYTYILHIKELLTKIEDFIIAEQKNLSYDHKLYALNLKYRSDLRGLLEQRNNKLYYNNLEFYNLKSTSIVRINKIDVNKNILHLEGFLNTCLKETDYNIYFEDNLGEKYYIDKITDCKKLEKSCLEGHYYYEKLFEIDIPIENGLKLRTKIAYKNNFPRNCDISFTSNCNLNKACENSYFRTNGFLFLYRNSILHIRKESLKQKLALERNLLIEIWKTKSKKLALYRLVYFILSCLIKKEIWIISDRPNKAGDNGEYFFKYLQTIKDKNIIPYFAIKKDSVDYDRIKKIGRVISYNSKKYKIYMLLASNIISSQASDYIINPFGKQKKFMVDLYNFKFTFLQHGITKDDISDWLNISSKNIDLFITAGIPEYNSILNGDYYYGKDVVKLTGFARFDNLTKLNLKKEKSIIIIPTWRQSLKKCVDPKTDTSIYFDKFKETDFFNFYNTLINNERLINVMKKYGYNGKIFMHPLFEKQSIDFDANEVFSINVGNIDYQKEFVKNSLLITDYSSVAFDFAYLRKPVIYTQFDKDTFFNEHSYNKGYFVYERDGFGEVCYDLDSAVNSIIKAIENDCTLEDKYLKNVNSFYVNQDEKNCSRIFGEIKKLKEG